MKILVNDEPLDFVIEAEKNLADVIRALESWTSQSSCWIAAMERDGLTLDLDDRDAWSDTPLDDIGVLKLDVRSLAEDFRHVYGVLADYVSLVSRSLEESDLATLTQLLEDYQIVRTYLSTVSPAVFADATTPLDRLFASWQTEQTEQAAHQPGLGEFLGRLSLLLNERLREVSSPEIEVMHTLQALRGQTREIENISVLLQTGRDAEAMRLIITFTELVEKTIRLYSTVKATKLELIEEFVEGLSFSEFAGQLNGALESLVEAFNARDSVLIGDQLEYEIAPRVLRLETYFRFPGK